MSVVVALLVLVVGGVGGVGYCGAGVGTSVDDGVAGCVSVGDGGVGLCFLF